jgi:hypothetical protein
MAMMIVVTAAGVKLLQAVLAAVLGRYTQAWRRR